VGMLNYVRRPAYLKDVKRAFLVLLYYT